MKNLLIFCIVFLAFNRFSSSLELRNKAFKSSGRLSKIRSNGEWFLDEDGRGFTSFFLKIIKRLILI